MSKKYTCAGMNSGGRVRGYADGGMVEAAASAMSGGKNSAQRALYNETRGDTVGEAIMGKRASDRLLDRKMASDADRALDISDAVPRRRD